MLNRINKRTLFLTMVLSSTILTRAIPMDRESNRTFLPQPSKHLILGSKMGLGYKPLQKHKREEFTPLEAEITPVKPIPKTPNYRELTVEATAYVSFCDTGCIGITKRGTDVKNSIYHESGYPIIATDPAVIPLGSIVEIEGRKYIADDIGSQIQGNEIDILVATRDTDKAFEFGRQKLKVKVYD